MNSKLKDWNSFIPVSSLVKSKNNARYISFGWGDRGFYFEMPTWETIKPSTIFNALFIPSNSAMHVQYFDQLPYSMKLYKLNLNSDQYQKLINFILNSFHLEHKQPKKINDYSYYGYDGFFKAKKPYHLFNTCNMWTNEGLKVINSKRPLWSPTKWSIEFTLDEFSL